MWKNYRAWEIDFQNFYNQKTDSDRLRFLLRFAVLAPSSHNSQPWHFYIQDNTVTLSAHTQRSLPVCDARKRLLYIALGCALENLLIAADYYGLGTTVAYRSDTKRDEAALVTFKQSTSSRSAENLNHLARYISARQTNRNPYSEQVPPESLLQKIAAYADKETTITLVGNGRQKQLITDLMIASRIAVFKDKNFRKEMAHYKRTNLTRSPIGMPGFTMGFGMLFSLLAPFMIKHVNVMRFIVKQEKALLNNYTPIVGIISTKEDERRQWVKTGQLLERVALTALRENAQTAISAVPLSVEPLQEILGIRSRPQIFFRIGYTTLSPGHAPRLQAEDVITVIAHEKMHG